MTDRGAAYSTWLVVFSDESCDDITKLAIVAVFHVHLGDLLEGSNFVRKHHVCVLSNQLSGCLENFRRIGDFLDDFDTTDLFYFHVVCLCACKVKVKYCGMYK